jgi:hypothetical protein
MSHCSRANGFSSIFRERVALLISVVASIRSLLNRHRALPIGIDYAPTALAHDLHSQ